MRVIVQDMGAFARDTKHVPLGMDIHTSTQMTVTGAAGAAYMKQLRCEPGGHGAGDVVCRDKRNP